MKKLKKILDNPQEIEYVLFDIFDTLIVRSIHPEYLKRLTSKKLCIFFNFSLHSEEVYTIRNRLEKKMCEKNVTDGFDLEFNFDDFCKLFYEELKINENYSLKDTTVEDFKNICRDIELYTEFNVQKIDKNCLDILNLLKNKKIPISCISDFYLPKNMIVKLLEYHKIYHFFEDVFISSENLITKRTSKLYEFVLKKIDISSDKILMIGDNPYSDFDAAKKMGLKCHLIDQKSLKKSYDEFNNFSLDKNKTINHIKKKIDSDDNLKKTSFDEISYSLFYFISKLHTKLLSEKIKDIFFISKEGKFLKTLFDSYQKSQGFSPDFYINSYHLKVSRKSTFIGSLKNLESETFDTLFRQYRKISLNEFLQSLNFTEKEIDLIIDDLKIDKNKREDDFPTSNTFTNLLKNKNFISFYEKNRTTQKNNFVKYLHSFVKDIENSRLYLVDVGWKGTIQDHIHQILENITVRGFYLGLILPGNLQKGNEKEGIVFSAIPRRTPFYEVFSENHTIFEILCGSSSGSADRYVLNENQIEVIMYHDENEDSFYDNIVKPIQTNILKKFHKLCDAFSITHFHLSEFEEFFAKKHSRLVFFPTLNEINFFQKFFHVENFGVFEITRFDTPNEINLIKKLENFIKLVKNPTKMFEGNWWGPLTLTNNGLQSLCKLYGNIRYYQTFNEGNKLVYGPISKFFLYRSKKKI